MVCLPANLDPRTLEGRMKGFGECAKCGGTWNWKETFSIMYRSDRGCFPNCIDCARGMTINELLESCIVLWRSWGDEVAVAYSYSDWIAYARKALKRWDQGGRIGNDAR